MTRMLVTSFIICFCSFSLSKVIISRERKLLFKENAMLTKESCKLIEKLVTRYIKGRFVRSEMVYKFKMLLCGKVEITAKGVGEEWVELTSLPQTGWARL